MPAKRNTKQRSAIIECLEEADRPLSPEEILELARESYSDLGIATVYRAIKSLSEDGTLQAVMLPGEPARYELSGKDHHHHFHCKSCDRVFEIPGCAHELNRLVPKGFQLESHELVFYGRCRECR